MLALEKKSIAPQSSMETLERMAMVPNLMTMAVPKTLARSAQDGISIHSKCSLIQLKPLHITSHPQGAYSLRSLQL